MVVISNFHEYSKLIEKIYFMRDEYELKDVCLLKNDSLQILNFE